MFTYDSDHVIAGVEKLRFFPQTAVSGAGATIVDADGRAVLDFSADWTAAGFGHGNPRIAAAVHEALVAGGPASVLSVAHPWATRLAEALLGLIPTLGADRSVYLGHAGTDANDIAVRGARHLTGRRGLIAFEAGYHGGAGSSQAFSGVHVATGVPADPDTVFVPYPSAFRPFRGDASTVGQESLELVADAMAGGDIAAVIVEPLQSDGGLVVPPEGFLAGLRALCDRHGCLLIIDEVKVGLGRTGRLLAHDHDGVRADIVTLGKALGGGLPLAATVGPAAALDEPAASALMTTVGNAASCAAALEVVALLREGHLTANAAARGTQLVEGLRAVASSGAAGADWIADVRGRGLSVGVELLDPSRADGGFGDAADVVTAKVAYRAWQLGLACYPVRGNVLELTPWLGVTADEIGRGIALIGRALADVVEGAVLDADIAGFSGWADAREE